MTINLTDRQAYYLWRVLRKVGGSPNGPRGEMDKILYVLGEYLGNSELKKDEKPIDGTIYLD